MWKCFHTRMQAALTEWRTNKAVLYWNSFLPIFGCDDENMNAQAHCTNVECVFTLVHSLHLCAVHKDCEIQMEYSRFSIFGQLTTGGFNDFLGLVVCDVTKSLHRWCLKLVTRCLRTSIRIFQFMWHRPATLRHRVHRCVATRKCRRRTLPLKWVLYKLNALHLLYAEHT